MMLKARHIACLAASLATPAWAQSANQVQPGHLSIVGCPANITPCFVPDRPGIPLGYQQIASLATATSLTVPTGANMAVIRAETQSVRYRDDGTAPTASVGQLILTTDAPLIYTGSLSAIQIIQTTASATLDVVYYK